MNAGAKATDERRLTTAELRHLAKGVVSGIAGSDAVAKAINDAADDMDNLLDFVEAIGSLLKVEPHPRTGYAARVLAAATIATPANGTGANLIALERHRQVAEEEYDSVHDDEHTDHSLALAACAYAAPVPLYLHLNFGDEHQFSDIWPDSWARAYDKRPRDEEGLLPAGDQDPAARIRSLVKAGALIAAEIDRISRIAPDSWPFPAGKA